jgi:phage N-6-adenine-methyltransferase
MSKTHANRLIASAETADNLTPTGVIPQSERHIRPITHLDPEQQREVWHRATETAPNGKVTAAHVEQVRDRLWPRPASVLIDEEDDALDPPMEPAQIADLQRASTRMNAGMFTSATPEWYTPRLIIDRVLQVFGEIDLDPCSNSADPDVATVPAGDYFTAATDGLVQQWHGRVYMNPPYGDEIAPWVDRMVQAFEGEEIDEAIALLPARTDTNWFRPLFDYTIAFIRGRLRFSGAENSAPFPSVVVYLGPDREGFIEAFEDISNSIVRSVYRA